MLPLGLYWRPPPRRLGGGRWIVAFKSRSFERGLGAAYSGLYAEARRWMICLSPRFYQIVKPAQQWYSVG